MSYTSHEFATRNGLHSWCFNLQLPASFVSRFGTVNIHLFHCGISPWLGIVDILISNAPYVKSSVLGNGMVIGERLRLLREDKDLSQGDIEKRTGLLRCYISRVENGHTVPSVETLEKLAHALEVPLYRLFYEADEQPKVLMFPKLDDGSSWGSSGEDAVYLAKLRRYLALMSQQNRNLLMSTLQKMTGSRGRS